ncbi:MAG: hypothetical protein ACKPB4_26585, partial [Sphaerospermopsis kisseleviana]
MRHKSLPLGLFVWRTLLPVILAVLAALAFPFVQGAINCSQGAKSLANLKEIGRATITWVGENNMRFPLTSDSSTNYWFRVLEEDVLDWKRSK